MPRAPRTGSARPAATAALCAVQALLAAGCHVTLPRGATSQPAVEAGSAELLAYAAQQPLVTAETGYRAIYALWKGESFTGDFESLTAALSAGRVVDRRWRLAAEACLDRSRVAYMVCRAIGIRSGVNWTLTGLGRYAWRELQYRNIAGPGSEHPLIAGGEFVGLIARADDYVMSRRKDLTRRAELGERPK